VDLGVGTPANALETGGNP